MGPQQTKTLLHTEGNHQQNKKTTYGIEEDISQQYKQEGVTSKIHKEFIQLSIKR